MTRAVLFDLDDTLFDHRNSSAEALRGVQRAYDCFRETPFAEFERHHSRLLEQLHAFVVSGRLGLDDARRERFRRLFEAFGTKAGQDVCTAAAGLYRSEYLTARRATEGAEALLQAVRQYAPVGIVSNNIRQEQQEKLEFCRLAAHVDVLVVSEEAGVSKPEPAIFQMALDALRVRAEGAVMIGDSWDADIVGARGCGIRPIWFNPLRRPSPDPGQTVAELHAFVPTAAALEVVLTNSSTRG
jgi:putative hydrolase of the HAD superfamily